MGKVLGLDIGIASVGWSLIDTDNNKIIDMGVRLFNSADASNNQQRRESRSARRTLRRKKHRLQDVKDFLLKNGFSFNDTLNTNPYEDSKNINEPLKINKKLSKEKYPCEIQLERLKEYGKVKGLIEIEDSDSSETLINVFTTDSYKREAIAILKQQKKYYPQIDENFIKEYTDIITRKREFYIGPGNER